MLVPLCFLFSSHCCLFCFCAKFPRSMKFCVRCDLPLYLRIPRALLTTSLSFSNFPGKPFFGVVPFLIKNHPQGCLLGTTRGCSFDTPNLVVKRSDVGATYGSLLRFFLGALPEACHSRSRRSQPSRHTLRRGRSHSRSWGSRHIHTMGIPHSRSRRSTEAEPKNRAQEKTEERKDRYDETCHPCTSLHIFLQLGRTRSKNKEKDQTKNETTMVVVWFAKKEGVLCSYSCVFCLVLTVVFFVFAQSSLAP